MSEKRIKDEYGKSLVRNDYAKLLKSECQKERAFDAGIAEAIEKRLKICQLYEKRWREVGEPLIGAQYRQAVFELGRALKHWNEMRVLLDP